MALKHRGWGRGGGSHLCCLCQNPEDINHIFFKCSMACFFWVGDALGWTGRPTSLEDWLEAWVPRKCKLPRHFSMLLFASLAWALWTTRNKMAIEHVFPNNAYKLFMYVLLLFDSGPCRRKLLTVTRQGSWWSVWSPGRWASPRHRPLSPTLTSSDPLALALGVIA